MNIMGITALAVCASVMAMCIKQLRPEMAHLLTVAAAAVLLAFTVPYVKSAVETVRSFAALTASGNSYINPILKITGIAYISQIGCDLCTDAGETALAGRVEMAGKLAICMISLPIAKEAFMSITGILN